MYRFTIFFEHNITFPEPVNSCVYSSVPPSFSSKIIYVKNTLAFDWHHNVHLFISQVRAPTPCIIGVESDLNVSIDNTSLLNVTLASFKQVVEVWMASFWVFCVEYPLSIKNTCIFLERVIMKKGGKMPSIVRKWSNRLMWTSITMWADIELTVTVTDEKCVELMILTLFYLLI